MRYFILLSIAFLLSANPIRAGTSTKSIVASRVSSAPRIDGILNDYEWQSAVAVMGFEQFDPEEGEAPKERTSVRILFDDNALYVGVMCFDKEPAGIIQQLTRRDRTGQADRFSVIIDSYHDHNTAFLFSGTVSGIQSDGVLSQDGRVYDIQWDAVWEYDAQIVREGWSAEFRIPFSALRFTEQDSEYVWGINFRRYIGRKLETDEWVMVPRKDTPVGVISSVLKMGHLSGMKNIHPPQHFELLPYQVSKANYLTQPQPFSLRKEFKGTAGLDVKYGVTNNYTLDMAINPDFGQVEVDQAILNLTVFETFYPEKRPFFLEGSQIFSFGNVFDNQEMRMFYSRRIGKRPFPSRLPRPGFTFVETPQTTTILGAGKLTGKTDHGLSLGLLSTVTDEEEAIEEDTTGNMRMPVVFEPRASYNVLRLKQDVLENSFIGIITTSGFKDQNLPVLSGGTDWNLRFDDGQYALDGYMVGSRAVSPLAYPNLDPVTGGAGKIGVGKLQGEHWLAFFLYDFSTRNFWNNDLGFYSQPHEHGGFTQISYKEDWALEPVRRYVLSFDTYYRWNWDGINTVNRIELEPVWQFRNFWTLTLDYLHDFSAYDDDNRGIVGLYHRPPGNGVTATLQTDISQPVLLALHTGYQNSARGLSTVFSATQLTVRPNGWLELTPGLTVVRTRNEEAWPVGFYTDDGRNLFGDRDVDQYDFSLRGIITFTRAVSVQFFTQVFLASGHYTNFRKLVGPDDLSAYNFQLTLAQNPDFNQKILNANVALRWEYLPGSTFYLVWTQARPGIFQVDNGTGEMNFSENFFDTFKQPMDNVILAKLSYWWSL